MFKDFDFSPGKITYFGFDLDPKKPMKDQLDLLEEDMLQVQFPNNFVLDLGGYADMFIISIIKKCNWEQPVVKKRCKSFSELKEKMQECIEIIRKKIKEENQKNAKKLLMFKDFDFSPGEILYLDFYVDLDLTIEENSVNWDKELVHIDYPDNLIFQIEWERDHFIVELVKNRRWVKPLFKKTCQSLDDLDEIVKECTKIAKGLSTSN